MTTFAQEDPEGTSNASEKKSQPETIATTDVGEVENLAATDIDKKMEQKMLWKFDLHVLPLLAMMYLFKCVHIHEALVSLIL